MQSVEVFLKKLITHEMHAVKVPNGSGKSVAELVRDGVLYGVNRGVFDGVVPASQNFVVHNRPASDDWPASADPATNPEYLSAASAFFTN